METLPKVIRLDMLLTSAPKIIVHAWFDISTNVTFDTRSFQTISTALQKDL